jgi:uncharacterized phage protein (TIGR01671 family)
MKYLKIYWVVLIPVAIAFSIFFNRIINDNTSKFTDVWFDGGKKQVGFRPDGVVVWRDVGDIKK